MSSLTPKLKLRKPDYSDIVSADIDIGENFNKIDKYIGFYLCTSSNRPAPFEGLKILEQDTGLAYIYINGIGWYLIGQQDIPPVDSAKGFVTSKTNTQDASFISTERIFTGLTTTFSSKTGRRYVVEVLIGGLRAQIQFEGFDPQPEALINLRWAVGSTVSTSSTKMHPNSFYLANFYGATTFLGEFVPNVNGNVTVGVGIIRRSGYDLSALHNDSIIASVNDVLLIRDVGPV